MDVDSDERLIEIYEEHDTLDTLQRLDGNMQCTMEYFHNDNWYYSIRDISYKTNTKYKYIFEISTKIMTYNPEFKVRPVITVKELVNILCKYINDCGDE